MKLTEYLEEELRIQTWVHMDADRWKGNDGKVNQELD